MEPIGKVQIGKQGVTDNFIGTLKNHFDKYRNVKVSVLKSAGHDKATVKKLSEDILKKLGPTYSARVIGFTICLKRWKKPVRKDL